MEQQLKTDLQIEREIKHKQIAEEFIDLVNQGMKKTVATRLLRKKYGIHSDNTIYNVRREYQRNQIKSLQNRIDKEGLFEAIDEICNDFKKS